MDLGSAPKKRAAGIGRRGARYFLVAVIVAAGLDCGKLLLVIATGKRLSGYGPIRTITAALLLLLLAAGGHASSISFQSIRFGRAVTLSARVVKGKVTARSETKVDGATLHYVEIAVDAVLKGTPAKPGERVNLSAESSLDPDGDALSYEWFYYAEAGTFTTSNARSGQPVAIQNFDQPKAWFSVPTNRVLRNGTMHIILAVTDHGTPRLTRYQRIIVTVAP